MLTLLTTPPSFVLPLSDSCVAHLLFPERSILEMWHFTFHLLSRSETALLNVVLCSRWPKRSAISPINISLISSHFLCRQRAPLPLCIFYERSSIVRNPSKRRAAILECSPLIVKCLLIILWFRAQRTHLLERLPHFPGGIEKEISHIKTLTWRVY